MNFVLLSGSAVLKSVETILKEKEIKKVRHVK